ncbi:MAG: pyridoxine 5'-phosphate synthase [Thermoanaerobaculia bacterium]
MTKLSVNLNKVALVRNSRGGETPSLVEAARIAVEAGCSGLTLHPRADARHATLEDILALARYEPVASGRIELNVEGDAREELLTVVAKTGATQFTLVPVTPGERTSHRGWRREDGVDAARRVVDRLAPHTRVSLFIDADPGAVEWAVAAGVAAVEIYTGPWAEAYGTEAAEPLLAAIQATAETARRHGLRVHAGHDLNLQNLETLVRRIHPDEVSIGHALISEALLEGLQGITAAYERVLRQAFPA